jgi:hypothetical protein
VSAAGVRAQKKRRARAPADVSAADAPGRAHLRTVGAPKRGLRAARSARRSRVRCRRACAKEAARSRPGGRQRSCCAGARAGRDTERARVPPAARKKAERGVPQCHVSSRIPGCTALTSRSSSRRVVVASRAAGLPLASPGKVARGESRQYIVQAPGSGAAGERARHSLQERGNALRCLLAFRSLPALRCHDPGWLSPQARSACAGASCWLCNEAAPQLGRASR